MKSFIAPLFLMLALSGCAGGAPFLIESQNQSLAPPPSDRAQIVFLDPANSVTGSILTALMDVTDGQQNLLAMMGPKSKYAQLVTPGHHSYATNQGVSKLGNGTSHLMEADVAAGKRYYVLLRFVYGHGFQLRPLRPSGPSDYTIAHADFPTWVSSTKFVEKQPHADEWFADVKDSIGKANETARADWALKSTEQKAELTLNSVDAAP